MSFIVVSIAENGFVHAWGNPDGDPFEKITPARTLARQMGKQDKEEYPGTVPTVFKVLRILGDKPLPPR
jgi:hypothetical protein